MNLADFENIGSAFSVVGKPMQVHRGRRVDSVQVDGATHFLKRFWLTPRQLLKRKVAQGLHELAMIDWLNANGFSGPVVVARGTQRRMGVNSRCFFLMRAVEEEYPLERFYRRHTSEAKALVEELAKYAAGLHDAGFYHRDFSEKHILVGRNGGGFSLRQIDLERASQGRRDEAQAAGDLKTLAHSIADDELKNLVQGMGIDKYLRTRANAPDATTFRNLFEAARPAKVAE